jgi:ubiquinone/menaquinone biosynthesis C-methylase UbiE
MIEKDKERRLNEETRSIYLEQHNKYLQDDVLFQRFLSMVSDPSYYHLTKADFEGKTMLDAGCGNTAYFEVAMTQMLGVGHITAMDLGTEWMAPLKGALHKHGVPESRVTMLSASTDDLPFEDEQFDFVFSNGVLMHLYDMEQINRAFAELSRVTRPGGYLYIVLGAPGGLWETELLPALRRYYSANAEFKELVDTMTPESWTELFATISSNMKKHTGEEFSLPPETMARMFDIDWCTFLQNALQVPNRIILELDDHWAEDAYAAGGFEPPKRCRRYVKRKNIRKYFAPLHYDSSSRWSRIMYGPGNMEFIARKKPSA